MSRHLRERLKIWLERWGLRPKRSFSLNGIDHQLVRYIGKEGGVFVEAGGNDGLTQSNTLFFELYHDWTGLLVEPIPALATKCRTNRPQAAVEQCALVDRNFVGDHVRMTYCNLMSLVSGAMGSSDADRHHLDLGRPFLPSGEEAYEIDVPARTLSDVLDAHGLTEIDFLSLDVEGFELQVLGGLDFARHRPAWMLVESRDPPAMDATLAPWYDLVTTMGAYDRLYRRKSEIAAAA